MKPIIDFGNVPLAGGFHKASSTAADLAAEKLYPLEICHCEDCHLVQVNNAIPGEVLFKDYFYFSSAIKTLADHFKNYAQELKNSFPDPKSTTIVELGCNDGVFLKPLREAGFNAIGIDPADNVVKPLIDAGFPIINDFFTQKSVQKVIERYGHADAILTSNSFAHIDDMQEVMTAVKNLLKPDGYLAFEVHYLGILLKEMQYDMMYHEHINYYSLLAIDKMAEIYGMEVFDIHFIPIHAGSIRFSLQNKGTGKRKISAKVTDLRAEELSLGLNKRETYLAFGDKVARTKTELLKLLDKIKAEGKSVMGYGASGRATALSAYCGLKSNYLSGVIDDAPAKQGAFTPGNHIKIQDSSILKTAQRPDYILLFAWAFAKEICSKNQDYFKSGGKFIVPLPEVRLIDQAPQ